MNVNVPASTPARPALKATRRYPTPTVLQMEAVECGAAALSMILGYYGSSVPLEELRIRCGVSRDGVKAGNILRAARSFGLEAKGFKSELDDLATMPLPMIVFWNFNHFLVVEGISRRFVYLNDPAYGPRRVTHAEFSEAFTGVALTFTPGETYQKTGERSSVWRSLAVRLVGARAALVYIVLVSLALVLPGLIMPTFLLIFVDNILVQGQPWVNGLLLGMALTAVLRAVLTWLQQHYLLRMETRLALTTSSRFFWHVFRLPLEFFNQRYSGEIGTRVQINDRVARLLSGELAVAVLNVALLVFYALLMLVYNVTLTLIGVAIAFLNLVALRYVARRRTDANQRLLQERGKLYGVSINGLQTIETLKATGVETDFFARWAGYQTKTLNAEQQFSIATQVLMVVPPLLTAFNTTVILFVGGLLIMEGALTIGVLVAFQSLMLSFLTPINQLINLGGRLQEVAGDMTRLDDVLKYPADAQVINAPAFNPQQQNGSSKLTGQLELRGVTFGYSRLAEPLIEEFSLVVEPGARIALVGPSGSGKSTISRLVTGLYEPWDGEILFDGKRRGAIPREVLSNSLALVDQEIFLFEGTIKDNLTLWDATAPEAHIIQATKDACIHDDIAQRVGGYDGVLEEGGRNFSGGQRQRLEIARALVNNPTLLVLDEATSALDPLTEKIIDDNLRRRGCTCLIIAHRLSTVRDCDEIIVLDRGRVVERGNHESLSKLNGVYARLLQTEFAEQADPESYLEFLY